MWEGRRVDAMTIVRAYENLQCKSSRLLLWPISCNATLLGWILVIKKDDGTMERLVCTTSEPRSEYRLVGVFDTFVNVFECNQSSDWVVKDPSAALHALCCFIGATGSTSGFSYTESESETYRAHARKISTTLLSNREAQKMYLETGRVVPMEKCGPIHSVALKQELFTVQYPFGCGYISYNKWDEGVSYMHFSPSFDFFQEFDMYANISISNNGLFDTHMQCFVNNTDTKRSVVKYYLTNFMYPPSKKISSPYVNFAFAQCECKDKTHHKNIAQRCSKVGLYGPERMILLEYIEQLSNVKGGMGIAKSVDALLSVAQTLSNDELNDITMKLLGVSLDGSLGDVIQKCREDLFGAIQKRLQQPLLARAIFTQIVGECPMKRIRYDTFVLTLQTAERVELLNAMCDAMRRGTVHVFCQKYHIQLSLLFRTLYFDCVMHAENVVKYVQSMTRVREFYQMHFSFSYATDSIAWDGETLRVVWMRSGYRIVVGTNKRVTITTTNSEPYMVLQGDEYARSSSDVLYICLGDGTIIQEPPFMLDDEATFVKMDDDGTITSMDDFVMKRCCDGSIEISFTTMDELAFYYMNGDIRVNVGACRFL
jgi:hypothetical protein